MDARAATAAACALLFAACAHRPPEPAAAQESALERQQARAEVPSKEQVLEQVELASLALAHGDAALADHALVGAVTRMQNFQPDGQFAAVVGSEDDKEWRGEPYEKMMACWYLGVLRLQRGDEGNALAMSKSAILADTGTNAERFRSDFIAGWVLQGQAYAALGETTNADRAFDQAIDALYIRALTDALTERLEKARAKEADPYVEEVARQLLLEGLPAGLTEHPRDPIAATKGALSYATDLRMVLLDGKRKDRPASLAGASHRELSRALDALGPLTADWQARADDVASTVLPQLAADEAGLNRLRRQPRVALWVEAGTAPEKYAVGRYGERLQIAQGERGEAPVVSLDGVPLRPQFVDSVGYQATTRGGRKVDSFLRGKAAFKDSAGAVGLLLVGAGDVADAVDNEQLAGVLYLVGGLTWVAGAVTNPRADTRQWDSLPDALYLIEADPPPGVHTLAVGDRTYTLQVPDEGTVLGLLPDRPPFGVAELGAPCHTCTDPALAVPAGGSP